MKKINIKNLIIGDGNFKIATPVVSSNFKDAINLIEKMQYEDCDLIELRADFIKNLTEEEIYSIRSTKKPIIFTLRSINEGGKAKLDDQYFNKLEIAIKSPGIDFIDLEFDIKKIKLEEMIKIAKENGKYIIISKHSFFSSLTSKKILNILKNQEKLGADIAKIAIMPKNKNDIVEVLKAGILAKQSINIPVINIAMGSIGVITRVFADMFGSDISFASYQSSSASGQINLNDLKNILKIISL